jgi:hypothetical protein
MRVVARAGDGLHDGGAEDRHCGPSALIVSHVDRHERASAKGDLESEAEAT